jgi:hypothetical protein
VGQYLEWKNQTEIEGWGTPEARMINGTGGFLFHPGVTREENLTVFVDELYRFVYTLSVTWDRWNELTLRHKKLYLCK